MKEKYIELMEKALSAYTDEHIGRYFNDVKENGLTEHGFPRLTANIGILIAHGRRGDLLSSFIEMMDFCCDQIPKVKAANDFSVREIICCIEEVEQHNTVGAEDILRWKSCLATIVPTDCYNQFASSPDDDVRNWALFTGVSEYFRLSAGLGGSMDFIDLQIASQLKFFDANGMYMDKTGTDVHQPIMYDIVPRALFAMLLDRGYRGQYRERMDSYLRQAGLLTLKMQSTTGEMAFGGRSNQFLHNEGLLAIIFEYEAKRYAKEGNTELAEKFKSAIARAMRMTTDWLEKQPIRHVKNRFDTQTRYGCEKYAYFDKYMITVASYIYGAYSICDHTIEAMEQDDLTPDAFVTSYHFHKLFLKCGEYAVEYDTNGDPQYDASGLGRVHRKGAPSAICMSCPCPAEPRYTVDIEKPFAFSMCSAIREEGSWLLGAEESVKHEVVNTATDQDSASATVLCEFGNDKSVKEHYTVTENGVSIAAQGNGKIGYTLPAFCFDGEVSPEITVEEHSLTVSYEGWICRYITNGTIVNLNRMAANRNGHYQTFLAIGEEELCVHIELIKQK